MHVVRPRVLLLAAALALAACGGPVVPLGMTELQGTVYDPPGFVDSPQVIAVAMFLVDDAIAASSFAELGPGLFLGLATTVADDGGYAMQLPAEEDIPDGILVPAADAVWEVADAGCTLAAEPPSARVSQTGFSLFPIPVLFGFSQTGIGPLFTTPTETEDGAPYEGGFLSWVFADVPVALTTDDACTDVDVALELRQGWNQVIWTPGTPVTLRDAAEEEALSTAVSF